MEVSDLLNFSFMSLGNTSSMVIALIFVVLTIILLLVLDYMSKLKLKVAEDEERAQLEAKAQAKAQKKKIKKEKKIEREQLNACTKEAQEFSEVDAEAKATQGIADRYSAFKAAWKNEEIYLGDYHIYAHAQRVNSFITACTLVKGAHVTYLPDAQFINFLDVGCGKQLTLVDFSKFRNTFAIAKVPGQKLNASNLVYYDCTGLDFDIIFETCKPAKL